MRLLPRRSAEILCGILLLGAAACARAQDFSLLLVNTESFALVDEGDGRSDVEIRFGEALNQKLTYERASEHFLFTDDLRVRGDFTVEGALSGVSLAVRGTVSGATVVARLSFFGAGLTDCDAPGRVLQWDAEGGKFSCGHGAISGSGRRLTIMKPSDEVIVATQSLQSDDDLHFPVGPGETWVFTASLIGNSREVPGFRFGVDAPEGSTCSIAAGRLGGNAAGSVRSCGAPVKGIDGAGDDMPYILTGFIRSGAMSGAVTLEWAQEKSRHFQTVIRAGSFLTAERVE
jgi:hypothetical protein